MTDSDEPLIKLTEAERSWERRRRSARRFTLTVFFGSSFVAAPNFVSCIAHSRVDSEVGVMVNGLPLVLGLLVVGPVVGVSTVIWGLGTKKARLWGAQIPFWERWFFRAIAGVLLLILWGFLADPLHRAMSCAGL